MRILRYVLPILGLVGLAVAIPAAAAPAPPVHYYLALGDSLSVGYQPVLGDTNQGYTDDLYATLKAKDPGLVLVKLGCSGETTTTMIKGGICNYVPSNPAGAAPAGNQLSAAEAFLKANGTAVKYVTIDIGANDVDSCAPGGSIDTGCIAQGLGTIGKNLVTIMGGLHAADGGKPQSVGMSYYDPFLEFYLTGTQGQAVAAASVGLLAALNTELGTEFATFGFKSADVANAFKSGNFSQPQNDPPYGKIPLNVRYICTYTYMCSVQNIHANPAGYQLIANTFAAKFH
jgi:lysophospholipase L1-like esterase